jgi:6-phosphogluconolactonase (cycloisomerase 2 family)
MTEWKDSHDQYLDEWVSFPYEIKRYQEWLPVYTPFPDTGDVLAQEMLDAIEGKLANLEEYLAQIIYYLGELQKRLNAIEYYMTKAADQMEAYLDSTKVLEIEQIHGVDTSLVIGSTYNDLNNIDTATLTDWQIIGESNFNFVDSDNLGGNYPTGVWGDGNFIYVGNHSNEIITYSVDGSGNLTHESTNNQVTYSGKIWGDGNFLYVAGYGDGIYSFSVDGSGVLTYIDHHDPGDNTYNVWGDGNFIYTVTGYSYQVDGKLHSYSVDGSGNLTHIDSHTLNQGQCKGVWGDGNFIYANQGLNLCSYSVDGSGNLTFIDSKATGNTINGIWGDGNFIYAVGHGIYSFSVDGSGNLSQVYHIYSGGVAKDVYADNNYIYMANEYDGLRVYSADGSGNLTLEYHHNPPGTQNYYGIWADNNFIYAVIYTSPGEMYIYSKPSVQTLYEYEGIGWDNDSIIIKYISDWDFGKDYLIHPLITFDGDYGIYPNIDIFTKAKTTIEGTKDKITDSEEVLEYYI